MGFGKVYAISGFCAKSSEQHFVASVRSKILSEFHVLQYDKKAQECYRSLKAKRIRIGTQDLRIAAIALAHNGILLTRNLRDFKKVPRLSIQDWST